jgi:hypothetical protein
MNTAFESKRDAWIVILIWGGALVCGAAAANQFSAPLNAMSALMLALYGGAAAFMLWVLYGIDYTLSADELLIRCGPLRYRVPLAAIDSVQPSRNPLSSPAASLDRLLIRYHDQRRQILISPTPKADFMRELRQRCPQLEPDGDGLARPGLPAKPTGLFG